MAIIEYKEPDTAALSAEMVRAARMVEAMVIDGPEMLQEAAELLQRLKARGDQLEEQRLSITRPMDSAKKAVMELFSPTLTAIGNLERSLKSRILTYQAEQERIAHEARIKAEAEAAAQRQKLLEEAAAKEAEAKQAAAEAEAAPTAIAEEAAIERTYEATSEATALREMARSVVAIPTVHAAPAKVKGISTRSIWDFELVNFEQLVRFIAANLDTQPGLLNLLEINSVALRAKAKAEAQGMALPGVRAIEKKSVASR